MTVWRTLSAGPVSYTHLDVYKRQVKQYATYYTTRKANAWASANPQEIQQM